MKKKTGSLVDSLSTRSAKMRRQAEGNRLFHWLGGRGVATLVLGATLSVGGISEALQNVHYVVLKDLDADVTLAKDGREGLVKLIDGYFDLDLVILDLHMPHLDGRTLIDRVRRLGGDSALKMFLFSGTSREELREIGENGLVNGVFSKLDPLDVLASHLARELGRQWPAQQPVIAHAG